MGLHNLQPANNLKSKKKRIGRGQGSGKGKTAGKGNKGQKARSGYKIKRGFEGGQQPLYKRLPKIGFKSRVIKPHAINVDRHEKILELDKITMETLKTVYSLKKNIKSVKLIGSNVKKIVSKIDDNSISHSGK